MERGQLDGGLRQLSSEVRLRVTHEVRTVRLAKRMLPAIVALALLFGWSSGGEAKRKKGRVVEDPYAHYVWPPPPDPPRIKLEQVIHGRADVVARSSLKRKLLGASPQTGYDRLRKPFAVAYDDRGRLLVTDSATAALIRFDRAAHRMDVLGTQGAVRLKLPLGVNVGPGGTIYVADVGLRRVVALDDDGEVVAVYGSGDELVNPTDALPAPDGKRLFVADSKAHRVVVFDVASRAMVAQYGSRGDGEAEFGWPTSLAWEPEGNLLVVDQINCRVQLLDPAGDYLDEFGGRGVGFGRFVRPKSTRKLREAIKPFTKRTSGQSMDVLVARLNPKLKGWYQYFKQSHPASMEELDRWVRQRLRAILKKRQKRRGRAKGRDFQRWPNHYFATLGLFSLKEAQAEELSLRRGATC